MYDPKWYHDNKGSDHMYLDRRGVVNGLRAGFLVPGSACDGLCRGLDNCATRDPNTCSFLTAYRKQLDGLNFDGVIRVLENAAYNYRDVLGLEHEVEFVFLFHEKPDVPCSERWPVKQWFAEHGIQLEEYSESM